MTSQHYSLPLTGKERSDLPHQDRPCPCVILDMLRAGRHFSWLASLGLILHGAPPSDTSRYASCVLAWRHAWELQPTDSEIPPYPWAPKYDSIVSLQHGSRFDREGRQAGSYAWVSLLSFTVVSYVWKEKHVLFLILSWDHGRESPNDGRNGNCLMCVPHQPGLWS